MLNYKTLKAIILMVQGVFGRKAALKVLLALSPKARQIAREAAEKKKIEKWLSALRDANLRRREHHLTD